MQSAIEDRSLTDDFNIGPCAAATRTKDNVMSGDRQRQRARLEATSDIKSPECWGQQRARYRPTCVSWDSGYSPCVAEPPQRMWLMLWAIIADNNISVAAGTRTTTANKYEEERIYYFMC
ncbi:uncharacterized protein LOC113566214 [Drosophila persimilis]|uniref:uncharacterized protein LOC113566214 n=1 Tax=Drosophila persimilis TaxID=7234 RepID=UPI000F08E6FE|nr:uncharacterized protein LOC113566214 [Drosophila persimilis]